MSMGIGVNLSDPRTAAAAARFHQLLQNGVPKEQASQIMQQEGGMIPIANLAIAYQQLQDAAKRSQVPPPSPGTVAQHIFAADAQMHGQMPPQQMPPQQMPSQQMPPQQPDPRMAGVANLPNTMGATGYKGGGIVAFNGENDEQQVSADTDDPAYTVGNPSDTNRPSQGTIDASVTNASFGAPGRESQFGQDITSIVNAYKASVGSNITATAARNQLEAQLAGLRNQRLNVAGAFGSYFTSMTPTEREKREADLSNIDSKIEATQKKLSAFRGRETPAATPIAAAANPAAAAAVAAAAANPAATAAAPVNEAAAQKAAIQGGVADFLGQTGEKWHPGMVGAPLSGMGGGLRPYNDDAQLAPPGAQLGLPGAYGSIQASLRGGSGGIPRVTADTSAADAELVRLHGEKAPGELGDYINQISDASKKLGIGNANEQMAQYLDKQDSDLKSWRQDDRRMALANAGFKMAMAASQPGQAGNGLTQLLSAGSVGGLEAAQGLAAINKEQRLSAQRMQENRIKLAQSNELINEGYLKEGLLLRSQAVAQQKANERYAAELAIGIGRDQSHAAEVNATLTERSQAAQLQAEFGAYGRHPGSALDAEASSLSILAARGVPGAQEKVDALNSQRRDFYNNGAAGLGTDAKAKTALQTNFARLIATERGQALWRIASNASDPAKRAAARNSLMQQAQLLQEFGVEAGGEAGGVTGGADLGNLFGPTAK